MVGWQRGCGGILAILALLLPSPAIGDDGDSPAEAWIGEVVAAAKAGAVARVAERGGGDPWLALEALRAVGLEKEAQAFASAWGGDAGAHLVAYLSRGSTDEALRAELAAIRRLVASGQAAEAWKRVRALDLSSPGIAALRLRRLEAQLAGASDDRAAHLAALSAAARMGHALGWGGATVALERDRFFASVFSADDVDIAKAALEGMAAAARLTRAPQDDIQVLIFEGGFLTQRGDARGGATRLHRALAAIEAADGQGDAAQAHATLSQALVMVGEYAQALHHSEQAERLYAQRGIPGGVLYARSGAIATYSDLGLDAQVVDLGRRQIEEAAGKDPEAHAAAQLAVGISLARLDKQEEAASHLAGALAHYAGLGDREQQALVLLNRGRELHLASGDVARARADFARVLTLEGVSSRLRTYARLSLADGLARERRWKEAEAGYAAVLSADRTEPDLEIMARTGLAERWIAAGSWSQAHAEGHRAISLLAGQVASLGQAESHGLLGVAESLRAADALVRSAHGVGQTGLMLSALEASRAVALLRSFGGGDHLQQVAVPAEVRTAAMSAKAALAEAQRAYERERRRTGNRSTIRRLHLARAERERVWQLADARLQREARRVVRAATPSVPTIVDLRGWCQPDEAFVSYFAIDDVLKALVVTRTQATIATVAPRDQVASAIEALDLQRAPEIEVPTDAGGFPESVVALRAALLSPLGLPAAVQQLSISPTPELANVPWPLLATLDGRRVATLVPSASTLLAMEHGPIVGSLPRFVVGVSNYANAVGPGMRLHAPGGSALSNLPSAASEARAVVRGDTDVLLTDREADETRVQRRLSENGGAWSVAHFACHGLHHRTSPSLSSLALVPTASDDGFVTAAELMSARLDTGLVVVSACDVGRATGVPGEGAFGIPAALLAAGARRVLANLWRVSDAAGPAFMARFYAELEQLGSPAVALARTQARFRAHPKWSHPYYWAGWVLWGSPR